MTDTPGDVAAKLEEALAVVESFDGGRAIQVGLGTYDSKQIDISLRDLRAAASLLRELSEREKALREALEPFAEAGKVKLCGDDFWTDDKSIQNTDVAFYVKFGDLRRAAKALEAK